MLFSFFFPKSTLFEIQANFEKIDLPESPLTHPTGKIHFLENYQLFRKIVQIKVVANKISYKIASIKFFPKSIVFEIRGNFRNF